MIRRSGALLALFLLLLAGCGMPRRVEPASAVPPSVSPISEEKVLLLYPFKTQLAVVDPTTNKVEQSIPLGRFATDYDIAPNGKVYIPLHDNPNDSDSYVAVLDRRMGQLKKIPAPGGALTMAVIVNDGTAFIRTGSTDGEQMMIITMDTETDQIRGRLFLPGIVQLIAAYSDTEVLIPVTPGNGLGGNLYLVNSKLEPPKPIFPFDLQPFAPSQVIRKPGSPVVYGLYAGFPPFDGGRRKDLLAILDDPQLVESHIDVWDIERHQLLRRIFLPLPSAQSMVLGPDGRLYVGHMDMMGAGAWIDAMTVVEAETGKTQTVKTVRNPATLMMRGDRLYIASDMDTEMAVLQIPDLTEVARVKLTQIPSLPPLTLRMK